MSGNNNVNVNDNVLTTNDHNNVNVGKYQREREIENFADRLLNKLSLDDKSRPFMCKAIRSLPESRIWQHIETVEGPKVKNKAKLFIWLCKRDGV